jgi:hypothetical protein
MKELWYSCVGFVPLPTNNEGPMEPNVVVEEHLLKEHMIAHYEVL